MTTIFVRDNLRAGIEAASGGQITVLYTQSGAPSCFFVLPKFNLEDIDASLGSGVHPAFIINGEEKPKLFIGQFPAIQKNGELLSIPTVRPSGDLHLDLASTYARNCGAGYHVITNAEWAAIALWCLKNGWLPSGNTDYGRNYQFPHETGVRWDGQPIGTTSTIATTLTGSGPIEWRHNFQPSGIADMVGNIRELVSGLRIVDGEIQVIQNNDSAAWTGSFGGAANWKAISLSTGNLVTPGTSGTVKVDSVNAASATPPENRGDFIYAATQAHQLGPDGDSTYNYDYNQMFFSDIPTAGLPAVLKTLGLAPLSSMDGMGKAYVRNYGTWYASRGEGHYGRENAGMFSLTLNNGFTSTHSATGTRVCKY